mmetsp:Transcript_33007/g.80259  ORF Transcript_33007/g.80259 Transcript_33007/m.80259 type:complete len:665 (-) Transcript_33007:199-2193(-)
MDCLQPLHLRHDFLRADGVDVHERPAQEGREAHAEHGANVAVARRRDHARLEAVHRLRDEAQHDAIADLLRRVLRRVLRGAVLGDDRLGVGVHRARRLLVRVGVVEEAFARLAAEEPRVDKRLEHRCVGAAHAHAEELGLLALQVGDDVRRHVDAHLVAQRDAAHGVAEVSQRLVDLLGVNALVHHREELHDRRAEASVHVEAWHILDGDDRLALAQAHVDGGGGGGLGGLVVRDHLEQRHLVDWREVVHPHHVLRPLGGGGDLADGQRRGVGRDDAVLGHDGLHLADDLVLHAHLLEDRLDHQVGVLEVALPRLGGVGEAHHVREDRVVAVLRQTLLLQLGADVLCDLRLAARQAFQVSVLEEHTHALCGRDLRDTRAHQPRAEHCDGVHLDSGGAEFVLLRLSLAEEKPAECGGLMRGAQLAEQLALRLGARGVARLEARLGALEDRRRRRVLALGGLLHLRSRLREENVTADRRLLEKPVEPAQLARLGLESAVGGFKSDLHRRALERARIDHEVDQTHLLRLVRLDSLARQQHVERRGGAHQLGQSLRPAAPGQEPQHHLRQAEHSLRVGRGHAVLARHRHLQPAAEARPIDRRHPRRLPLHLLDPIERHLPFVSDCRRLLRRLERLEHLDVRACDPGVLLRRDEHCRLDGGVGLHALDD